MSRSKSQLSPYTWTSTPPYRAGWYWHRDNDTCDAEILRVFKIPGELEWSYQWGIDDENDIDWVINDHGSQWSNKPILEPVEPPLPPEILD